MKNIESGKVKLRSRYIFIAEKLGLGSAVVLSILLVVLFCNLLLYYLRATDNLSYLSFGKSGILAFLESFPYLLVALVIVSVFVAGLLLKHTGTLYKRPFSYLAIGLVVFALVAGTALAYTSVDERLEDETYIPAGPGMFLRPLFQHDLDDQSGVAGRIVSVTTSTLVIQTPEGERTVVVPPSFLPLLSRINPEDFVVAVGTKHGDVFDADQLRIAAPNEMPMIRRFVHHHFDIQVPPMMNDSSSSHCFDVCAPGTMCGSVCDLQ